MLAKALFDKLEEQKILNVLIQFRLMHGWCGNDDISIITPSVFFNIFNIFFPTEVVIQFGEEKT